MSRMAGATGDYMQFGRGKEIVSPFVFDGVFHNVALKEVSLHMRKWLGS